MLKFVFFIKQTVQEMDKTEKSINLNFKYLSMKKIEKKRSRNFGKVHYLDLIYVQSKSYFNCSIKMHAPS